MKILFKYPSRSRPELFKTTLNRWYSMLSGKHECHFVVSLDNDDETMNTPEMGAWLANNAAIDSEQVRIPDMAVRENFHCIFGNSKSKVEACNADMGVVTDWDIVVLVSDDMIPQVQGYDDIIAEKMVEHFPDLDGALHFSDGLHGQTELITLSIMGRKLYDHFGYIYHPYYSSFYCDTEFSEVVRSMGKYKKIDQVIVKHDWKGDDIDELARKNHKFWNDDRQTYKQRKEAGFPMNEKFYSQNDEERYIVRHFLGRTGSFLDIGAWDGKTFSNTYRLAELGWSGVCVEPSPIAFKGLFDNYKDNDKVLLVNCAVSLLSKMAKFYESGGDAIGSLDEAHKAKWDSRTNYRTILIKPITLGDLFDTVGYDFDFINIDTEGTSVELLANLPFEQLPNLKALCVEHDGKNVVEIAGRHGFRPVYECGENIVLVK